VSAVNRTATPGASTFVAAPVAVALLWIGQLLTRELLPDGHAGRLAATVALLMGVLILVWFYSRIVRGHDEFARSLHLFALAIAFPVSLLVVFAYGLLSEEGLLDWFDARDLVAVMLLTYAGGVTVARRRFQ
jgi:hypothetical protein